MCDEGLLQTTTNHIDTAVSDFQLAPACIFMPLQAPHSKGLSFRTSSALATKPDARDRQMVCTKKSGEQPPQHVLML